MNYGMFTPEGNIAVTGIVLYHKAIKSSWGVVDQNLSDLAASPGFGEATDTEVRECVFVALGFADNQ
jgi:hypothetical protein